MTVLTRPKRGESSGRRRLRGTFRETSKPRADAGSPVRENQTDDIAAPRETQARGVTAPRRAPTGSRREAAPPHDHATYACECGLVFEASVSTSVGCPHCGTAQAW